MKKFRSTTSIVPSKKPMHARWEWLKAPFILLLYYTSADVMT